MTLSMSFNLVEILVFSSVKLNMFCEKNILPGMLVGDSCEDAPVTVEPHRVELLPVCAR